MEVLEEEKIVGEECEELKKTLLHNLLPMPADQDFFVASYYDICHLINVRGNKQQHSC